MKNLILGLMLMASACYTLQAQEDTSKLETGRADNGSLEFIRKAAEGGLAEVRLGQLALERGSSPQIRDYGKRMVSDHQKANDELRNFAQGWGYREFPEKVTDRARENYDNLARLSGAEFDRAFVRQMIKDHEETVELFRREAENGQNQQLKSWAKNTLPVLEQHLQDVRNLERDF